jgi:hypothetical protein
VVGYATVSPFFSGKPGSVCEPRSISSGRGSLAGQSRVLRP